MAPSFWLLALAACFGISSAQDRPDTKPAVIPPFDMVNKVSRGLEQYLEPANIDHIGAREGYAAEDFEVYNVKYADCDEVWTMCRHKEAVTTIGEMAMKFGHAYGHARASQTHDRHAESQGREGGRDHVQWKHGDLRRGLVISHTLDSDVRIPGVAPGGGLSNSQVWRDAYNANAAVITGYGRTKWAEDLAEAGAVALYDVVVPGGAAGINPNFTQVFHQVATYQTYYRDLITAGVKKTCTFRMNNSDAEPLHKNVKTLMPDPQFLFGIPRIRGKGWGTGCLFWW
ncbi:Uu.00g117790.m01.CDS01 [Anthostomella pinea]|uniref:Uu.00g117790.m01.CDS01 n=1 Tax=Anthostomella pinea TaxID=933095 RepID=A0AAI8VGB2_9PEZI|nr:Uu.00g117790.m01.CDS01 [Anthostomella pinea]